MVERITGKTNGKLKLIRALSTKKGRQKSKMYFVEGIRMVNEAIEYKKKYIKFILASETFYENNTEFVSSLDEKGFSVYIAKDDLFNNVCNTVTPQGIAVVLSISDRELDIEEFSKNADFALILDGIKEPGNLGTIIRTAEAAGVDAVYLVNDCADIYNPKAVRSTMGSIFRVKFKYISDLEPIHMLKQMGFKIIASSLRDSVDTDEVGGFDKKAIVIGSEAFGVSEDILKLSDIKVKLKMHGRVESLNAAIAAAILMYTIK